MNLRQILRDREFFTTSQGVHTTALLDYPSGRSQLFEFLEHTHTHTHSYTEFLYDKKSLNFEDSFLAIYQ